MQKSTAAATPLQTTEPQGKSIPFDLRGKRNHEPEDYTDPEAEQKLEDILESSIDVDNNFYFNTDTLSDVGTLLKMSQTALVCADMLQAHCPDYAAQLKADATRFSTLTTRLVNYLLEKDALFRQAQQVDVDFEAGKEHHELLKQFEELSRKLRKK